MQLVLETPKSRIDGYKGWPLHFNVMFDLWKIFQYLEGNQRGDLLKNWK